jgi:hypothetical protein
MTTSTASDIAHLKIARALELGGTNAAGLEPQIISGQVRDIYRAGMRVLVELPIARGTLAHIECSELEAFGVVSDCRRLKGGYAVIIQFDRLISINTPAEPLASSRI